ncbi:MAG: SRPBCC family protein [Mycobacterium sp.]|nr:SRPBCC family protein [Mycobacterium sp.]
MAESVSESVKINASPAEVMAVIANLEDYPNWSDGFTAVEIITNHDDGGPRDVSFAITTPVGKDSYELSYVWVGEESVSWTLNSDEQGKPKSSMMKKLVGSYTLVPDGDGTKVTYTLEIDPKIPMMGFMKKKAAATIVDQALNGLKKRVEG